MSNITVESVDIFTRHTYVNNIDAYTCVWVSRALGGLNHNRRIVQ